MSRTLLIGLGNSLLTDDAVGPAVARAVVERLAAGEAELAELSVGGLELVERLVGCERAVIIDAIQTEGGRIGDCRRLDFAAAPQGRTSALTHRLDLAAGLELGRRLGWQLPERLAVYVVEVADPYTFGETMTPAVQAAVARAAEQIIAAEFGH